MKVTKKTMKKLALTCSVIILMMRGMILAVTTRKVPLKGIFTNVKFPEFCHYDKKYCVYNTVYHLLFGYFYKQDRIFEEVKEEDWKLFENLETFHDKPFRPEKLSHH